MVDATALVYFRTKGFSPKIHGSKAAELKRMCKQQNIRIPSDTWAEHFTKLFGHQPHYFDRFPGFKQNPGTSLAEDLDRLADQRHWGSRKREIERQKCDEVVRKLRSDTNADGDGREAGRASTKEPRPLGHFPASMPPPYPPLADDMDSLSGMQRETGEQKQVLKLETRHENFLKSMTDIYNNVFGKDFVKNTRPTEAFRSSPSSPKVAPAPAIARPQKQETPKDNVQSRTSGNDYQPKWTRHLDEGDEVVFFGRQRVIQSHRPSNRGNRADSNADSDDGGVLVHPLHEEDKHNLENGGKVGLRTCNCCALM